ncbi:MAG: hypothetical protein ABII00_08305 [Elusimicrobiota bacterium]
MRARYFGWMALAAVVTALASPARASGPALDSDQMDVDVKAIVAQAREAAREDSAEDQGARVAYRSTRDCAYFRFEPNGPAVSESVVLTSTEYVEECFGDREHRHCHEVPRYTNRERVQIELRDRKELYPWERETFEACLDGHWLSVYTVSVAHEYSESRVGGYFTLTAGKKVPMNPDRDGIAAGAPKVSGAGFVAEFQDRWASYYEGEDVVIKAALYEVVPGWFDRKVAEAEISFPAAGRYAIDFSGETGDKLKAGKKYYVYWGFKRIGEISKPTYVKRGKTEQAVYSPADASLAAAY